MAKKVLIVYENKKTIKPIFRRLVDLGFSVVIGLNGEQAIEAFHKEGPELIIIDVAIPNKDDLEICRYFRKAQADILLIILASKSEEGPKILALELGADDCIIKPFSYRELTARMKSLLRRKTFVLEESQLTNDLVFYHKSRKVLYKGRDIYLTPAEFQLVLHLNRYRGKIVKRDDLVKCIHHSYSSRERRSLDVHISKLREKFNKEFIKTVYGIGYRLKPFDSENKM
ncbi:response regulator transcription factor [Bacillus solitudinis]|uniref:response regulator transcription factor n=1 Tax=Bacillus solitudinis TaxID=2014074 RepID=UPI000C23E46B|nr:response regulator transcription factor [Bacillus solitudinis]